MSDKRFVSIMCHKKCKTPLVRVVKQFKSTTKVIDYCVLCNEAVLLTQDKIWMVETDLEGTEEEEDEEP